jgi:tricorn protease
MRVLRTPLVACAILLGTSCSQAQGPIRFARTPDIAPDGKTIAFSYLGRIWIVDARSGIARPVTGRQGHDVNPLFSPDGCSLAFASNRHGSYDVFVVSLDGGEPRRLTYDSADDHPTGWSPDGKTVIFTSTRNPAFPFTRELYTVPASGGAERRIMTAEGTDRVFSPKGDRVACVRGHRPWFRKGYRGSANDDIWISNADGTMNRRLTTFDGQDRSPMWSPNGEFIYYVSEVFGTPANIVRQKIAGGTERVLVTADSTGEPFHKEDGVRLARISRNGEWIVYECGADIWVSSTRVGSQSHRLAIEVPADSKAKVESVATFSNGATEYAVSPDERHLAFAVRGDLFLLPITGGNGKTKRLTDHPANDHGMAWAPDHSKMIFLSDRGGQEDIYLLEADDPEHPKLLNANQFKATQLTNTPEPETQLKFSPDGRRVSFLRAGKLWSMKPDGTNQMAIINDVQVFDYEWSPDAHWIVYARRDGSFASELYIVPITGPTKFNPPRNITRYATYNGGVSWSRDGKKLAFIGQRQDQRNLFVLSLQRPNAPGFTESAMVGNLEIDWDAIPRRVEQPVPHLSVREGDISPDGTKVALVTSGPSTDLWVAGASGGQLVRLTSGQVGPRQVQWSKRWSPLARSPEALYFLDGRGQIRRVNPSSGGLAALYGQPSGAGGLGVIPFEVKMTIRNDDVFHEMFDQCWRSLAEHYYDANMHGIDWEAIRKKYRPLVRHVAFKEDLYALLYLMMGELNASHLGVAGLSSVPEEPTADLGLIFDESYSGRGLRIKEVVKGGPCDRRGIAISPGDLIMAVDGVEVTPDTQLSTLLNGKVNELVVIQVSGNPATPERNRRRFEVQATSRGRVAELMYERWVERNEARVAELSKGKLGYIHIPSMDTEGLNRFIRSLYSDHYDKEAIVLDVRYNSGGYLDPESLDRLVSSLYNGEPSKHAMVLDALDRGGHTHDQVLSYLGSKEKTIYRQREGGVGLVLRPTDRKWAKPLVLLINDRTFGDAEIFADAFRTLGLGKLVGQPTSGFVIGNTSTFRLIDGSILRIPSVGVYSTKGVNLEKEGVLPDVRVEQDPDQIAKGVDPQLNKAVEVLQTGVAAWKNKSP